MSKAREKAKEYATGQTKRGCIPGNAPFEYVTVSRAKGKAFLAGAKWAIEEAARVAADYSDTVPTTWGIAKAIRALLTEEK